MDESVSMLSQSEQFDEEQRDRGEFAPDSTEEHALNLAETRSLEHQEAGAELLAVDGQRSIWQDILWHEWRNTDDEEYAEHLFKLIADKPVGRLATIVNTCLGMIYGGIAGLLVALIGTMGALPQVWGQASWPLLIGIGALVGGTGGLLARLFQRRQSTRVWLAQLTANLAPDELGMIGIGLVFPLLGGLVGWVLGWVAGFGHLAGTVILAIVLVASLGAKIVGWLVGFGREPNPKYLHRYRFLWFWWRKRPPGVEIEMALHQACRQIPVARRAWVDILQRLEQYKQEPDSIGVLIDDLQSLDWVKRFMAWHLLAASGGEGVASLHHIATQITSPLRRKAVRLLQGIEQETTIRLAHRTDQMLCPRCLALCGVHSVSALEDFKIIYYGCRMCQQSREFWEGDVVAVLDTDMGVDPVHHNNVTRINWLVRRELFDFHSVEIVQATDEEVERFAIQVGNDTESFRQPRYKQMHCAVSSVCQLSENSLRILGSIFKEVIIN